MMTSTSSLISTSLFKKPINIFYITDLHLGHRRFNTRKVTERILKKVKEANQIKKLDYLMVLGDVFDGIVKLNQELTLAITSFANRLLKFCLDNDIKLRILEGTNTHDYNQSKLFVTLNEDYGNLVDLRYFDDITYVKEDDGLTYIAVPDNMRGSTLMVEHEIQSLLYEHNGEQVDLMMTHGQYFHHVPTSIIDRERKKLHDSELYSSWVRFFVANGHIHPPSKHLKIETVGSFDRCCHGEEHDKGGMLVTLYPDGKWDKDFIVNEDATLFVSKTFDQEDIAQLVIDIECYLDKNKKLQEEFLRIYYKKGIAFGEVVKHLKLKYPKLTITPETIKEKEEKKVSINETFNKIKVVPITKDTIVDLLREELINNNVENIDETLLTFTEFI